MVTDTELFEIEKEVESTIEDTIDSPSVEELAVTDTEDVKTV